MVATLLIAAMVGFSLNTARPALRKVQPPHVTMQEEQPQVNMVETATASIDRILQMLGPDMEPPSALMPLKQACTDGDEMAIGAKLYDLLIQQCLDYEVGEDTPYGQQSRAYLRALADAAEKGPVDTLDPELLMNTCVRAAR